MKTYKITEYRPATLKWEYTVEAETEEEALESVMRGDISSSNFDFEEEYETTGEFEVEER
jgi:hypothetical protein